jgi:hypothetical protein
LWVDSWNGGSKTGESRGASGIKGLSEPCDVFGRKVKEIKVPKGQNEVIVNVSKWNRGIYIAVLWQNGKLIAKEKFMIMR